MMAAGSMFVYSREHNRTSSIHQLLKRLPLRDRLLRRIPKDLLEEPLPPPIPPPLPYKLMWATAFIASSAGANLIYGLTLYMLASHPSPFLRVDSFSIPIPRASQLIQAQATSILFYSAFLFLATVLIIRKHHQLGAILALIFSILTIFAGGPIALLIGALGLCGSILALTQRKS